MYGLANVGIGCGCQGRAPALRGLGATPELKRDLLAGGVAFVLPVGYHYLAPKKWPRAGKLVNVGAVIGLYFLTTFVYNKVTT